jgi:RHS repeat-associated protein
MHNAWPDPFFYGIDNKGRQADNGDMDAIADKDNPSALSLQPSARTEASVAEYLFYHSDHLGTVRLITDNSGTVISRHDYEPFGVEIAPVVETANNTHRFTGHERDASTGYDYMHYRSYGSNIGRFMKPDNMITNVMNPQSWNLYSYVNNSPINFNDPTGHDIRGKQGKMGMHQALMGVPNVDVSGMLTPVEFYEYYGGFAQIGSGIPSAGEYYRGAYSSAQEAKARGFNFYSPYGYTGNVMDLVSTGGSSLAGSVCGNAQCVATRQEYVLTIKSVLSMYFMIYYPDIYISFLGFDIDYSNSYYDPNGREATGWTDANFSNSKVGALAFDLSKDVPFIAYSGNAFSPVGFTSIFREKGVRPCIMH